HWVRVCVKGGRKTGRKQEEGTKWTRGGVAPERCEFHSWSTSWIKVHPFKVRCRDRDRLRSRCFRHVAVGPCAGHQKSHQCDTECRKLHSRLLLLKAVSDFAPFPRSRISWEMGAA